MTEELLVVVEPRAAGDGPQRGTAPEPAVAGLPVVGRLAPRVAIVSHDPAHPVPAVPGRDGVRTVVRRRPDGQAEVDGTPLAELGLNDQEEIFVSAWVSGASLKAGRPGDGQAWDAPGFSPPDLPPR